METSNLKKYAIQARKDFLQAVTTRAARIGVTKDKITDYEEQGDLLILGGTAFPKSMKAAFESLRTAINRDGFDATIDAIAYTWFNRFMALRYMEVHDYLDRKVLSSTTEHPYPDIMQQAQHVSFSQSFKKEEVRELLNAGNKDEELYRYLVVAQCNELNKSMPFLFEKVSDLSELLLPDNLLATDSLIRKLVTGIEESQWKEGVEIIGWLYQFYISEKKDQVIGKVVKSEDIPAATQLFTPNWIVKYLVQNSVGAYWLGTYPDSPLKEKMEYYIEPAEQTPEVQEELRKITPEDINPETITVMDPAAGSGHILVEAYRLLKEIYLERGYRPRDIPRLILEKNLFGLDIDRRAAQMAGFALLMEARRDDRSILDSENPTRLNVLEIKDSKGINARQCAETLLSTWERQSPDWLNNNTADLEVGAPRDLLLGFLSLFDEAKTFGSLIQIPESIRKALPAIKKLAEDKLMRGDMFQQSYAGQLLIFVKQAELLAGSYDAVVANPPYMGSKGMNELLKESIKAHFLNSKADLFAVFIERGLKLSRTSGFVSMITMQSWMFLSSYEELRKSLVNNNILASMLHLGARAFGSISGEVVQTTAFTLRKTQQINCKGVFYRLIDGDEQQKKISLSQPKEFRYLVKQSDFSAIPGSPIAYWVSERMREIFKEGTPLGEVAEVKHGLTTGKNESVVRYWVEISAEGFGKNIVSVEELDKTTFCWVPYNKGGDYRKWYGNCEYVLRYDQTGRALMASFSGHRHDGKSHYFREGVTWTFISSSAFGVRLAIQGSVFDVAGSTCFPEKPLVLPTLGLLASKLGFTFLKILNPTLNFQVGNVKNVPMDKFLFENHEIISERVRRCVSCSVTDWDSHETSWDFKSPPLLTAPISKATLSASYDSYTAHCLAQIHEMQSLETENNRLFIDAYGLQDELSPEVPEEEITLHRPDRAEDIKAFLSYSIGCMLGRYSLDEPGLIYAHSGNKDFDPTRYKTYPADADGIIPIMDQPWFEDDATIRFLQFIKTVWSEDTYQENIEFVAESLNRKKNESPEETIQRYFSELFFKDHLRTYKKRPIYWMFASGKERAFQCLVYLHRYNESTLSQMRTEYVLPLQAKMRTEEQRLDADQLSAASTAEKNKLRKQLEKLHKKQAELLKFDELLQHYANQRISLDLDDGVKVNYGKFGGLLAEVKQVTGE